MTDIVREVVNLESELIECVCRISSDLKLSQMYKPKVDVFTKLYDIKSKFDDIIKRLDTRKQECKQNAWDSFVSTICIAWLSTMAIGAFSSYFELSSSSLWAMMNPFSVFSIVGGTIGLNKMTPVIDDCRYTRRKSKLLSSGIMALITLLTNPVSLYGTTIVTMQVNRILDDVRGE